MTLLWIPSCSRIKTLSPQPQDAVPRNAAYRTRVQQPTCNGLLVACWLIIIASSGVRDVSGLKLLQVSMPSLRLNGESARLLCQYDLQGDALYSVKWYKGGREFYRYVPKDHPPVQVFPVDGVAVDKSQSDQHQVTLINTSLTSSGRYKCEVSVDAPSFQTSSSVVEMNVIYLPLSGPRITLRKRNGHDTTFPRTNVHAHPAPSLGRSMNFGGQLKTFAPTVATMRGRHQVQRFPNGSLYEYHYRPGNNDIIELNCTSGSSKPAAALEWYANGIKVQHGEHLIEYAPFGSASSGEKHEEFQENQSLSHLETSVLGLRWKMPTSSEDVMLNCTSAVSSVYWSWTAVLFTPEVNEFSGDDSSVASGSQPSRSIYQQGVSQYRLKSKAHPMSQSNFVANSFAVLFCIIISTVR